MKKSISVAALVAVVALLSSCGKDELSRQENQRKTFDPALRGAWVESCEANTNRLPGGRLPGGSQRSLQFDQNRVIQTVVRYAEPNCTGEGGSAGTKVNTTSISGTYRLAHNFKEGLPNSIVFMAGDAVSITGHTPEEIVKLKGFYTTVQAALRLLVRVPAPPAPANETVEARALRVHNTSLIVSAGQVADWVLDRANSLSRSQFAGYVAATGTTGTTGATGATGATVVGLANDSRLSSHTAASYELDNNVLQIKSRGEAGVGGTYIKQ